MKTLIISCFAFLSLAANAAGDNIHYYHEPKPETARIQRPAIPNLSAPAPLSTVPAAGLTLQWTKVEEATAYAVQVSTDPVFFALVVNEPIHKDTSYTFKDVKLESGKKYYWRVAAIKSENQEGFTKSLFNRSSFSVQ